MHILNLVGGAVKVSSCDLEWIAERRWYVSDSGYVRGYAGRRMRLDRMHRLVLEHALERPLSASELVDHINCDKLDNRRSNLRIATKSQNGMNTKPRSGCLSQFKGVGF